MDYILNLTSHGDNETTIGIITISSPRDPDKNSVKIIINVTGPNGYFNQIIINSTNFDHYFSTTSHQFEINVENLNKSKTYNVSITYEDQFYMQKGNTSSFMVGSQERGDFHILQDLIDRTPANGTLVLPRGYTFTDRLGEDGFMLDDCYVNITKPITIIGGGHFINAKGYTIIFNITADHVVLKDIKFENGNATGQYAYG